MSFFRRGIQMLPERWGKVVVSEGQYFQWHVCFLLIIVIKALIFTKKQREFIQPLNILTEIDI